MFAIQVVAAGVVLTALVAAGRLDAAVSAGSQTATVQPKDPTVPTIVPRAPDRSPHIPRDGGPYSQLFVKPLPAPPSPRGVPPGPQRLMNPCGMTMWIGDGNLDPKIRWRRDADDTNFKVRAIVPPVCVPTATPPAR
jgi:hypothetical protein